MTSTFNDYMNSFLGVVVILLGLIAIPEIRQKRKYIISVTLLSILMLYFGIDKLNRDKKKDRIAAQKEATNNASTEAMNKTIESISRASNITNVYLRRLDSMGIKRDTITNMPIVTKYFINYIKEVAVLNQY